MAKRNKLTADQFARQYAYRSRVTVEWLKENGREVRPCNCGEIDCEGWQMAHIETEPPHGAAGDGELRPL